MSHDKDRPMVLALFELQRTVEEAEKIFSGP